MDSRGGRGPQEARSRRKERKPTSPRRSASGPATRSSARRAGSGSSSTAAGAARIAARRGRGARRARWATIAASPARLQATAPPPPSLALPGSSLGSEMRRHGRFGEAEIGEMRRVRFEEIREFACRWPLGDPRSGEFAYCGLTPAEGPVLLRRPLPDGLSAAEAGRGRARASGKGSARSRIRGGWPETARECAPLRSARTRRSGLARPRPLRAASTPTGRGAAASPPRARSSRRRRGCERTASSARA